MTAPTATPPVGSMAIPSPRQQFLDILKKEHETTRKVVDAFPGRSVGVQATSAVEATHVSSCGRSRSKRH